jgi:hypothetical protein
MACTDPCSCCHGACCTDGSCAEGVNCYDCEAEGGVWQGAGSTCTPNPCGVPCTVDEDCYYCESAALILVDPCDGTYSTDKKCCPEGSVAWVDNPGDARQGNCVDDCDPSGNIIPGAGAATLGSCCDDVCFEGFPCPP